MASQQDNTGNDGKSEHVLERISKGTKDSLLCTRSLMLNTTNKTQAHVGDAEEINISSLFSLGFFNPMSLVSSVNPNTGEMYLM